MCETELWRFLVAEAPKPKRTKIEKKGQEIPQSSFEGMYVAGNADVVQHFRYSSRPLLPRWYMHCTRA
jgi:hypothetical protein